jgi:hypothetical protein
VYIFISLIPDREKPDRGALSFLIYDKPHSRLFSWFLLKYFPVARVNVGKKNKPGNANSNF